MEPSVLLTLRRFGDVGLPTDVRAERATSSSPVADYNKRSEGCTHVGLIAPVADVDLCGD